MVMSRRTLILGAGGTSLALIGAGGYFAVSRTPYRALAAWSNIASAPPADIRLDAFRHAILAPNPHNRQPWLIRLIGDDRAIVSCDLERRLPETDPFDRQILIGFGCFLELARIAAAERGVRMEMLPFPEGLPSERIDLRPIAQLRFVKDPATPKDPLFAAITTRRSHKQPFDTTRAVAKEQLDSLVAQRMPEVWVAASRNPALVETLRAQTWDAWNVEHQTIRTWRESVDLMRIGRAEIEANPDGISIGGPLLEALAWAGQLSREQMATPGTKSFMTSIDRYRPIMATGMAYAWITTPGNSRLDQLATGRAYVRMNLAATQQGLGFHPVSQALQEFPEMEKLFKNVVAALGTPSAHRVQMLVRLGYGSITGPTPRWPLESRLLGA